MRTHNYGNKPVEMDNYCTTSLSATKICISNTNLL